MLNIEEAGKFYELAMSLSSDRMWKMVNSDVNRGIEEREDRMKFLKDIASKVYMWEDGFFIYECDVQLEVEGYG